MNNKEKFECLECGCYFWVDDRNKFKCPNCEYKNNKSFCRNCDKYTKYFNKEKEEWICLECETETKEDN